jgi:hypothetical protein
MDNPKEARIINITTTEYDPVNHPYHYTQGNIECIDAIKESLSREAFQGFLKGNAIKYLWRCESKNNTIEDLNKAIWYINKLIESYEEEQESQLKF